MTEAFLLRKRDARGVVTVTLNRPDRHNAFDDQMIGELSRQFEQIAVDKEARLLVLAANGKSFSAGADIGWMRRAADYSQAENRQDAEALAEMMLSLDRLPMPTIARVQGSAIGGGVGLISCCDVALAADHAQFGTTEVRLGIIPAVISPFVVRAVGPRQARRLFLTGERIDAATALRAGLVHETVSAPELDGLLERTIEALLAGGPRAQRESKDLVRDVAGSDIDRELMMGLAKRIARVRATDEAQDGLSAFLNKAKPGWT
ncbi:MAG: enoyl-CoA hydratase/isomerase family protein [Geminicoccaceae bacterium]